MVSSFSRGVCTMLQNSVVAVMETFSPFAAAGALFSSFSSSLSLLSSVASSSPTRSATAARAASPFRTAPASDRRTNLRCFESCSYNSGSSSSEPASTGLPGGATAAPDGAVGSWLSLSLLSSPVRCRFFTFFFGLRKAISSAVKKSDCVFICDSRLCFSLIEVRMASLFSGSVSSMTPITVPPSMKPLGPVLISSYFERMFCPSRSRSYSF
mmetsp:Transcript_148804/g.277377  ORF Transcript_148804/g.277377 Transcript_148804/m.277377 type:complete len:212 (-) Transcript_148804:149-784(-)